MDEYLGLNVSGRGASKDQAPDQQQAKPQAYTQKVKGFHLAFNVHDPIKPIHSSPPKKISQIPKMTTEQLHMMV